MHIKVTVSVEKYLFIPSITSKLKISYFQEEISAEDIAGPVNVHH